MKRQELVPSINSNLIRLVDEVQINSGQGLFDINAHSENLFAGLLSIVYETEFKNANIIQVNHPAIDLISEEKGLVIQVTSNKTKAKVKHTLDVFIKNELHKKYKELKILVIEKNKTKSKDPVRHKLEDFNFDQSTDVIDISDLGNKIQSLKSVSVMTDVYDFLNAEMSSTNKNTRPSEVETIIALVNHLSSKKNISETNSWKENPDPKNKIERRFSEYKKLLNDEIIDLLPRYAPVMATVNDIKGVDSVNIEFIRSYIRSISNSFLIDNKSNPKIALDKLTEHFETELRKSGKMYDYQAIRFFLINELLMCNLFAILE